MTSEHRAEAHPINWTEARLRGIASDYFPDPKHWPAAILCLKHMLMEQSKAAAQQAQAEPVAWRDHVESRIRMWRQRTMNTSGDLLAIDDFMGPDSIDDLVDWVCDEWAAPTAPAPQAREPLTDEQIAMIGVDHGHGTEVEGYPNGVLWFSSDLIPFARAVIAADRGIAAAQPKEAP